MKRRAKIKRKTSYFETDKTYCQVDVKMYRESIFIYKKKLLTLNYCNSLKQNNFTFQFPTELV